MPFIRVTRTDNVQIDVNIDSIIQFYPQGGRTRIDLRDNLSHDVKDEIRSIRGYIKKAEGLLPEKQEMTVEQSEMPLAIKGMLSQGS